MWRRARSAALALALSAGASGAAPAVASAHGMVARADLPIPKWLFAEAAALVLAASFLALSLLWSRPRLSGDGRWLEGRGVALVLGRPMRVLAGAVGIVLLGIVVWSGFEGTQIAIDNFAPTFVYVVFWVGLVLLSLLVGDVFRAFNPWAAIARGLAWVGERLAGNPMPAPLRYPDRLGRWPAVAGLLGFAYLELASDNGSVPLNLAIATVIYSVITLAGMSLYGVDPWLDRGEAFSVYFNLFSRVSPLQASPRDQRFQLRVPLSGLSRLDATPPGTVTLLVVMIGAVTFDGLSAAPPWIRMQSSIVRFFTSHGFDSANALRLTAGLGLLAAIAFVFALYHLGVAGIRRGGGPGSERAAAVFAHSLVPIAAAYVGAHYLTFLLTQGQAIVPLSSDPLGHGWNLFGTADLAVNYGIIGVTAVWYLQVGLVVVGHVAGLIAAHDCALVLHRGRTALAARSQYWMLGVMVAFTMTALLLLAQAQL